MNALVLLVALGILVGLVGIVVPVLPGLLLVWGSVLAWAVTGQVWWLAVTVTITYAVGLLLQYLLPGRRLRAGGVPTRSLVLGVVVGAVGFFVVPVVGAVAGFVLGIYLSELQRHGGHQAAWPSTMHALRAVGLSMAIELTTGLLIAAEWVGALLIRRG